MRTWTGAHRYLNACVYVRLWLASKWESWSIWRVIPEHPDTHTHTQPHSSRPPLSRSLFLFSLLFPPPRSFLWFYLRQNWIPQFHTLSAVDKGLPRCTRAPEKDTACPQNAKIGFLKTMRSICWVKPDERPIFRQPLFLPPSPCFPIVS